MPKFTDCPSQPDDAPSIGRVTNRHIADSRPPSEDAGVDMLTYGNAHLWHTYATIWQCTMCPLMAMHASLVPSRTGVGISALQAQQENQHNIIQSIALQARQEPIIIAVNEKCNDTTKV